MRMKPGYQGKVGIEVRAFAGAPAEKIITRQVYYSVAGLTVEYKGIMYRLFGGPYTQALYHINLQLTAQ